MKRVVTLLMISGVLMLSGCSVIDDSLEQAIMNKSGILENEEYMQYQQYLEAGLLDESGQYIDTDLVAETTNTDKKNEGQIRVTFAENRYVEMGYFSDSNMMHPIDINDCYLSPGDTIYGKVVECVNPNSNLYRLAEYRVIEYDLDGNIKKESKYELSEGTIKYEIPSNFVGKDISIMPIGEYPNRNLSMEAYYVDDNGKECSLGSAGTWSINGSTTTNNIAQISPIEAYVLKYTFDKENYFFVGCEPECFTREPERDGFVEFWEGEPTDEDMLYRVELHQYLNLKIKFDEAAKIRLNQENSVDVKKNKEWFSEKLKYGDIITVETAGKCTILGGNYQHIVASKDPITGGYRYTLKVVTEATDNAAEVLKNTVEVNRIFNVTLDANCDYGTCTYKLDGKSVTGAVTVQEGQELTLTYKITNKEYIFADKSDGIGVFFHDIFKSNERTVMIPITAELEGNTIDADEWFDIIKKED